MTYTFVADGSSDQVLVPIINWSLQRHGVRSVSAQWADLGRIPGTRTREQQLQMVLALYPCDALFIHRDAEGEPAENRRQEIADSLGRNQIRHVPVVPIRMTEAWLLADESAIRRAAGNPNGRENLDLPALRQLEALPNPKQILRDVLTRASGLNAHRRSRFPVQQRVQLIPNYIDDYSNLDVLTAFQALQTDIRRLLTRRETDA